MRGLPSSATEQTKSGVTPRHGCAGPDPDRPAGASRSPPASLQPGASRRSTALVRKSAVITNPPGHRATRSQWDMWANPPGGTCRESCASRPPPRSQQVKHCKDQVEAMKRESPVFDPARGSRPPKLRALGAAGSPAALQPRLLLCCHSQPQQRFI